MRATPGKTSEQTSGEGANSLWDNQYVLPKTLMCRPTISSKYSLFKNILSNAAEFFGIRTYHKYAKILLKFRIRDLVTIGVDESNL